MGNVETAISTEALNRIIKEVNALTPQERRELIDRLAQEENSQEHIVRRTGAFAGTVKHMAPDFDESVPLSLSMGDQEIAADTATLQGWLNEARTMRAELPLTSDSVDILRELREVRSKQ